MTLLFALTVLLAVVTIGLIKRYIEEKREVEYLILQLEYLKLEFNLILTEVKLWLITNKKNKKNNIH